MIAPVLALLAGCTSSDPPAGAGPTVTFGGDVFLGRAVNEALHTEAGRADLLGGLHPLLQGADLAVVNAEGVISAGGRFFDKGEPRPFTFRAHPHMIDVLRDAGVDAVTVGNNHAGDYGPAALVEMFDRLAMAGIGYTGGGVNPHDAHQPFYARVGDVTLAVVGVDLTGAWPYQVLPNRPGTLAFKPSEPDTVVAELGAIAKQAREHADVVVLTPHWGMNGATEPGPDTRALARRLLGEGGFDAIVGHSAHFFQGAELFDGEPVIYDVGNLIADVGGQGDISQAFLWELELDRRGVRRAVGHPLHLSRNRAEPATDTRDAVLATLQERSAALGTTVEIAPGPSGDPVAVLPCDPGSAEGPAQTGSPPKRPAPESLRLARDLSWLDALPPNVEPQDVRWGEVRLVGWELVADGLLPPKAAQIVVLYLTADGPVSGDVRIQIQAVAESGQVDRARHIPGDWLWPADTWQQGRILRDVSLVRLQLPTEGAVEFRMGLVRDGALIAPDGRGTPLVTLGSTPWKPGVPRVWGPWEEWLRKTP